MTAIGSSTPTYDADGNVTNDFSHTYAWDANGQPTTIDSVGITYDALGRMVEQNRSGAYTQIVYAPSGAKLALMNGSTFENAYVPLPAGATAVYNSTGLLFYRHPDWQGSARLASTTTQTVYYDVAYGPYGETYAPSGTTYPSFTGMNQDTVSNLYDFPAREYNGIQGRWPSPDPGGMSVANPMDPQSWNRYGYVRNSPLENADPNGMMMRSAPYGLSGGGGMLGVYAGAGVVSNVDGNGLNPAGYAESPGGNYSIAIYSFPNGNADEYEYATNVAQLNHLVAEGIAFGPFVQWFGANGLWIMPPEGSTAETPTGVSGDSGGGGGGGGYATTSASGYYPDYKPLFCTGDALAAKGLSIGLDVVGAIPGLGNMVSASAGVARAVNGLVTWGGGVAGGAMSLSDETPYGAAPAAASLGLALADVSLGGTKAIPVIGNFISAGTGIYDISGAYKAYRSCMAGSKYD